jgi:lipoprotein-releasing system permease protein
MRSLLAVAMLAACGSSSSTKPVENKAGSTDKAIDKEHLRELVIGVNAHVVVLKSSTHFAEYRDVVRTVEQNPEVVAAEAFQFGEVIASSPGGAAPIVIAVKGVDPASVGKVLALPRTMTKGTIQVLAATEGDVPIILGDVLARSLNVGVGDPVHLTHAIEAAGDAPRTLMFKVAGVFHTGFDEYDRKLAYTSMHALQDLLDRGDEAMGVEAVIKDRKRSKDVAQAIEKAIGGPPFQVMDWFELNHALFVTRD